ncbi:SapC family protein [Pseudoxanthomonas composti]|uniref:Peptidase n=1 Tax=Pseudoxanthomonas composti TaxID=2137479 RepID=A0A4Q1JQX9_9GAMM|nr:SapC family protein [Pseudoxanthomonas composti]RXQ98753.1 peptidase [Pseudoxanthomonas composti]
MSRPVLLNNVDHRDLRVLAGHRPGLGDEVMAVVTFPAEFRQLQAYYPIVFQKDPQGRFHPTALLGLQPGQNLFLKADGWDAHYVPLAVARQPFIIGLDAAGEPMLHVDIEHPRVSAEGQPLFLEHGGHTPFLQHTASLMRTLHDGLQTNDSFIATLLEHELLESFVLNIQLPGQAPARMEGCYAIAEEKLRALEAQTLHALARSGALEAIYMAVASLSHLRDLIGRLEAAHARQS